MSAVGILSGVVERGRQEVFYDSGQGVGPVSGDLSRLAMGAGRCGEERCRRLQIALPRQEHVDDLPVLVNGSIDVPPRPGDPHVGLVDEPATTDAAAARPARVHQQRRELLDPSIQGHVVDLDTPVGDEFLQVPLGQSVAQVPAHGDQNDIWRELESGERRLGGWAAGRLG